MPKVSDVFSSNYFRGVDLKEKPVTAVIEGWSTEVAYNEEVYVLSLQGHRRRLKLTRTNADDLARLFGDEMDSWIAREVELYSEQRPIRDRDTGEERLVDLIRVRAPSSSTNGSDKPKRPDPVVPLRHKDLDDEIPFNVGDEGKSGRKRGSLVAAS
jgi:hypothetical protein